MSLQFTDEYYPALSEISPEELAESREFVTRLLQPALLDVDLAPGTPTGDMVVSPLAAFHAASNVANSRLMSDLVMENVANGIIYSCPFVTAYLGNFAVYDVENLRSTGVVRLTFSSPAARTIQKAVRFRFGNTDDYELRVADSGSEGVYLLAAGTPHTGAADTYVLSQTSAVTWAVDVPLEGIMTAAVARGVSGTATEVDAELVGIVSAIEFLPGLPPASLKDLAKLARKAAFSLTAGSRASTKSLVLRNWPETVMVSPIVTGDVEMQRSAPGAAMILQQPAMDVYVRSARDLQRETQTVALRYVTSTLGAGTKASFRGVVGLLHRPSRIVSVEWSGSTTTTLVDNFVVYSRSASSPLYGSMHCGSRYEEISIDLTPLLDVNDTPLIPRTAGVDGDDPIQYAMFTIVYDADPLLETMASTLEAPDHVPAGVSVLVKSGPLVLLDDLIISFTKQQGTRTTLTAARSAIVEYFRTAGYPDVFRQTALHDIMRAAGADRITAITCAGTISPGPASHRFLPDITAPATTDLTADWLNRSVAVAPLPVTTVAGIVPSTIVNEEVGAEDTPELWAATGRTVRYCIDPNSITFLEV